MIGTALVGGTLGTLWTASAVESLPDTVLFLDAARDLLTSDWSGVFADPTLQVGPLYLLTVAVLAALGDRLGLPSELVVAGVLSAVLAASAVPLARQVRRLARAEPAPPRIAAAGLAVVLAGPLCATAWSFHFEELATGVLLVTSALQAGRGRLAVAGVLIGLAASVKLWGLIGLGLLLLAPPGPRRAASLLRLTAAGVLSVTVLVATYLPFWWAGEVSTGDKAWRIAPPAPLALMWDAPAVLVVTRVAVDPYPQAYYLAPAGWAVVMGVWASSRREPPQDALAVSAAVLALWVVSLALDGALGAATFGLGSAACLAWLLRRSRTAAELPGAG
jgi:hypothetical protein